MSNWSAKRAGFESGGCRERSFGKRNEPHIPEFEQWRIGLLANLAKANIPTQQMPDETIVAKIDGFWREMKPDLQKENYEEWVTKMFGTFVPFTIPL